MATIYEGTKNSCVCITTVESDYYYTIDWKGVICEFEQAPFQGMEKGVVYYQQWQMLGDSWGNPRITHTIPVKDDRDIDFNRSLIWKIAHT